MAEKTLSVRVVMKDVATGVINKIGSGLGKLGTNLGKVDIRLGKIATSAFRMLTSMRTAFAGVAAFFVGRGIIRSFDDVIDKMDAIAKVSGRTGIAVEAVGELELIAQRAEIPLEQLAKLVGDVTSRVAEAAVFGRGTGFEVLQRLGIDATNANGQIKDTVSLLDEIVRAVGRVDSIAEREFLLKQLGGEQAPRLLQVVNLGVEEFTRLKERAREIGVFSEREVELAAAYKDAVADLSRAWDRIKGVFVSSIAPIVIPAIETMRDVLSDSVEKVRAVVDGFALILGPARELDQRAIELGIDPGQLRQDVQAALSEILNAAIDFGLDIGVTLAENIAKGIAASLDSGVALFVIADGFRRLGTSIIEFVGEGLAGLAPHNEAGDAFNANMLAGIDELKEQWAPDGIYGKRWAALRQTVMSNATNEFRLMGDGIALSVDESFGRVRDRFNLAATNLASALGGVGSLIGRNARAAVDNVVPPPPELSAWTRFFRGIRGGAQAAGEKLGDLATIGAQVGTSIAQSLASQATDALFALVDGTKTASQAFREMAVSVLRDVARMITQILILRAVGSFAGLFAPTPQQAPVQELGFVNPTYLSRGGWAIPRYDRGGFTVPGPNINRDMVLGMLAPGERVLSRQEVRGLRSGRYTFGADGGGGGDTYNLDLTVNLSGGATRKDVKKFQDAVEAAMFNIQARKPRSRRQLGLTPQGV